MCWYNSHNCSCPNDRLGAVVWFNPSWLPHLQEQKLALQSRSKDSHLSQLREVEKRFGVLSRLCATVKQAHGKLESNGN